MYCAYDKESSRHNLKKLLNIPRVVLFGALFVFLFTALYNIYVYERVPHVHDEIVYLFQARIFLAGHVFAASPCAPASFDFPHMINNGKWYSIYPPGFPFLLMIGLLLKAPYLINPFFGALSILIFYLLGKDLYDRRTGILAAVLGSLSPWLLLMSSTMMSHTTSMFFNALFLLLILKSIKRPTFLNGLLAGTAFGAAFLIRPINAAVFASAFLAYLLYHSIRDLPRRVKNVAGLAVTGMFFVGILLAYNQLTNGDPFKMGYVAHYGKSYSVIFGRPATQSFDYTPLFGTLQITRNLAAINSYLFGWPLSSLWLMLPLLWIVKKDQNERKKFLLLTAGFLSMLVVYFFFWGSFVFLGARMFFDAMPLLLLMSARGLVMAAPFIKSVFPKPSAFPWNKAIYATLIAFFMFAFFIRFPRWVKPTDSDWYYLRYDGYMAGSSAHIRNAIESLDIHNSVILMKFMYAPLPGFPTGWWGSGFMSDTPRLDGDIIYANDRGPLNKYLFRCYPERRFFFYTGTIERGLLLPMSLDDGEVVLGTPLSPKAHPKRRALLLPEPKALFKLYSREFTTFMESLYKENDIAGIDVVRLKGLGATYQKAEQYQKAAFCYEAALQLEKEPQTRFDLLNSLSYCYQRSGQVQEAKILGTRLADPEDYLYKIIPERGF